MVEKIGHIKNPLTVIAIFAGIAEISGTVVLPFIAPEIQATYVLFLMAFPFFLVGIFFYTLHTRPTALYSPSDYKDETNFVAAVRNATPAELSVKLRQEVKEVEADIEQQDPEAGKNDLGAATPGVQQDLDTGDIAPNIPAQPVTPDGNQSPGGDATPPVSAEATSQVSAEASPPVSAEAGPPPPNVANPSRAFLDSVVSAARTSTALKQRALGDLMIAEKLAISRLSKMLKLPLQQDVRVMLKNGGGRTFDAFAFDKNLSHAVEVKFFPTQVLDTKRLYEAVYAAKEAAETLRENGINALSLHLCIVSEADEPALSKVRKKVADYALRHGVDVHIYTTRLADLTNEHQFG